MKVFNKYIIKKEAFVVRIVVKFRNVKFLPQKSYDPNVYIFKKIYINKCMQTKNI